jgi:transposase
MGQGRRYSTVEVRSRAVSAVHRGLSVTQVAETLGVGRNTIHRWLGRFQERGAEGLARRSGSGRPRKLSDLSEEDLCEVVLDPATEWGFETDLWTVGRLHSVITRALKVHVSRDTIWRRLRDAGLTYQKPERRYFEIDERAREQWLTKEVPQIRETVRKTRAILYFQDESNVSLTALLGKTWAPRGQTPTVRVTGKRGSVSAMSAISKTGSLLFRLYNHRIASPQVIAFLAQMLQHHTRRHLVVVMDQAPPHVSKLTKGFVAQQRRLHVFYLPKYSPDWNPDEKVWNHLKNHELKAHQATTAQELEKITQRKLQTMSANRDLLQGLYFRCCVSDFFG